MRIIKIIFYFAILFYLLLCFGCDTSPFAESGSANMATPVYLARINEDVLLTNSNVLTGGGWALSRVFPDSNFNIIQGDINYRIDFADAAEEEVENISFDSDNKWIPYTYPDIQPKVGPFKIYFSGFHENNDIGLESFLDPFDNNTQSALQFYAVFPDELSSQVIQSIRATELVAIFNDFADESQLQFRFETTESVEYATALFMLEMEAQGKPGGNYGDDYVLNFKFFSGNNELTIFTPGQDVDDIPDFFCVYDKRLLDNAYTFIDETIDMFGDVTGDLDRNPNQLAISGFTWHCHDANTNTNTNIIGRVAYNLSGQDAPAEFNEKMSQQQTCIQWFHWYAEQQGLPVNAADYYSAWDSTFAPFDILGNNGWENYVNGQNAIDSGFGPDGSLGLLDIFEWPEGEGVFPLQGIRPYIPAISSYHWANYDEDFWYLAGQGAGVDCVGFVYRTANYNGNNITLPDLGAHPWTWRDDGILPGGSWNYIQDANGNWRVFPRTTNGRLTFIASTNDQEDLGKVMPGDIFYWETHVGLVDYVEDNPERTRWPGIEGIHLIESTRGKNDDDIPFGCVTNHKILNDYRNNNWIIGRLIRN